MRLLLVDDAPPNILLIELLLREIGVPADITAAEDGLEFLAALSQGPFDLILLDINMPRLTGLEALREMGRERSAALPIIVLTSSAQVAQCDEALALGARDCRVKPLRLEEFEELLRELFAEWVPAGVERR